MKSGSDHLPFVTGKLASTVKLGSARKIRQPARSAIEGSARVLISRRPALLLALFPSRRMLPPSTGSLPCSVGAMPRGVQPRPRTCAVAPGSSTQSSLPNFKSSAVKMILPLTRTALELLDSSALMSLVPLELPSVTQSAESDCGPFA